jgi:serine/threonine protein kinase
MITTRWFQRFVFFSANESYFGAKATSIQNKEGVPVQDVFVFKSYREGYSHHLFEAETKAYDTFKGRESCSNIATFYGSFMWSGFPILVLECAPAGDLANFFKSHKPPEVVPDILLFWRSLSGVLRGLAWIHEKGFVLTRPTDFVMMGWR